MHSWWVGLLTRVFKASGEPLSRTKTQVLERPSTPYLWTADGKRLSLDG
jgi:hypothetical protein